MKIDRRIHVFISSKCGGQYSIVRKVLEAFENDYGPSMPVTSAYLNEVGESDVIIVLIENRDDVTDPVKSEINRARELQKKIIFFL